MQMVRTINAVLDTGVVLDTGARKGRDGARPSSTHLSGKCVDDGLAPSRPLRAPVSNTTPVSNTALIVLTICILLYICILLHIHNLIRLYFFAPHQAHKRHDNHLMPTFLPL